MVNEINETDETPEQRQQREYLDSIADILAAMRPDHEIRELAKGCPDPARFADEEDWEWETDAEPAK